MEKLTEEIERWWVSSDTLGGSGWFMEIHTLIRFSVLAKPSMIVR
jgi:hypothetical protein